MILGLTNFCSQSVSGDCNMYMNKHLSILLDVGSYAGKLDLTGNTRDLFWLLRRKTVEKILSEPSPLNEMSSTISDSKFSYSPSSQRWHTLFVQPAIGSIVCWCSNVFLSLTLLYNLSMLWTSGSSRVEGRDLQNIRICFIDINSRIEDYKPNFWTSGKQVRIICM